MPLGPVAGMLSCPHCGEVLYGADTVTLRCPSGHAFDVARQGYANLLAGPPPRYADTAAMVAARERFLTAGHYTVIRSALRAALPDRSDPTLVDAGAGSGWYLAGLLADVPAARGLAVDVSVPAIRRAARRHPRLGAVVGDTWHGLPVRAGVADVVLSVFAPRDPDEFARILAPQGRLLLVAAEPDHLIELRAALGLLGVQPDKELRLAAALAPRFTVERSERLSFPLDLDRAAAGDLVAMGPNAFHPVGDPADLAALPPRVTAAVRILVAQPRSRPGRARSDR